MGLFGFIEDCITDHIPNALDDMVELCGSALDKTVDTAEDLLDFLFS